MTRDELIREMKSAMQASPYHDDADAALTAIEAAGYVVVPRVPTEAMKVAARDWPYRKYGKPVGDDGASGCYAAMIAAATEK